MGVVFNPLVREVNLLVELFFDLNNWILLAFLQLWRGTDAVPLPQVVRLRVFAVTFDNIRYVYGEFFLLDGDSGVDLLH